MPLSAKPLVSSRPALASWLFVCVMVALVAAVLTCAVLIDRFTREEAREQATRYLQINADALRDALDRGMAQHYEEVHVIARLDQVARHRDPAQARRVLESVRASFPLFTWIGLTDAQGNVIASADGLLEGKNVAARPWFKGATQASFVGDVHAAVLLEKLLPRQSEPWRFVDIAVPIFNAQGELQGVLGTHLSWTWAGTIKRELVDQAIERHQAEALVLSTDGTVLLGPPALQGRKLEAAAGHLLAESKTRGAGRYPGLGWKVVLRQPEAVALASFRELERRIMWAAFFLCMLLAPLVWLLARRFSVPLLELTAALESRQPPKPSRDPVYREAEVLGQALRAYAERQADDAARLQQINDSLQQRVAERTEALAASEQRLRDIADNMPALIAYVGADERFQFANSSARKIHGVAADRVHEVSLREGLGHRYDEHRPHIEQALAGRRARFEGQVEIAGRVVDFETHFVPDIGADGKVRGLYVLSYDQSALKAAERRLRTIADNTPALISYVDRHERFQFCNATYGPWLGLDPASVIGQPLREALGNELYAQRKPLLDRALAGQRCDFDTSITRLGVTRHLHTIYLPDVSRDGTVEGVYALAVDVSAMKAAEEQLMTMARTDTLTGLPNRLRFNEKLAEALARSRRRRQPIALLFLDVDKFKSINDTLGHAAGDEVLKVFAARLSASVRETDTVARLAGDEFVVILEDLHTEAEPQFVARKILTAINRPFAVQGHELNVSTSIGIAFHAEGTALPEQLLSAADKALYQAKAERNTYCLAAF
ncbi:diguanylate cyclase domain-containing protein [Piscinibacter sp. HJYY11]|uniref:sensor domain-containing diguanylate cyclase n=1 Tax=Piscinibacter sp. HJYY11 TaxID=2801333 RepID=UPI00191EAB65|nr:diguanylate cyclase [Piscinibacter sp. HJYY11]MBL0728026.1 diguanylate cyclase [Piscinibacter sp. HJYY11]